MALPAAFDGFVEQSKRVSPTCLITFERNRYSVLHLLPTGLSACGSIPNGWSLRLRAISSATMCGSSTEAITGRQRRFTIGGITLQSSSASLERYAMVRPSCNCRQPYDNCRIRCFAAPAVIVRWSIFLLSFFITTSKSSSSRGTRPAAGVATKTHVLNLLHRLIDGKTTDGPDVDTPQALTLAREPKANVERYDGLRVRIVGGSPCVMTPQVLLSSSCCAASRCMAWPKRSPI